MISEVRERPTDGAYTGFRSESLEQVARLLQLLEALCRHPFLQDRIALKGGTALNLFVFDLPRLSVDIDLNYIGAAETMTMKAERPIFERAVDAVRGRLGLEIRRVPADHAGGKWQFSYRSDTGRPGTLELDLNFMLRTPLWPTIRVDSRQVGSSRADRSEVRYTRRRRSTHGGEMMVGLGQRRGEARVEQH